LTRHMRIHTNSKAKKEQQRVLVFPTPTSASSVSTVVATQVQAPSIEGVTPSPSPSPSPRMGVMRNTSRLYSNSNNCYQKQQQDSFKPSSVQLPPVLDHHYRSTQQSVFLPPISSLMKSLCL
ncbi:hypothetical protein BGX29_005053, partial [Mortierella sp. GBA35]